MNKASSKENIMDSDRIAGNWKQVRGKIKEKWGKLTDDDLDVIDGRVDQLLGKLQERYGLHKDAARQEFDGWKKAADLRAKAANV
jgi:uncharacterized protein YjbJ (UPF0337 family)